MLDHDGDAGNQVIWFTMGAADDDDRFDQTPISFQVIDDWMRNLAADPEAEVETNKPSRAVDTCFDVAGNVIASGDAVWNGILDDAAPEACTEQFPVFSTSHIVAGAPISGDVFKCELKPLDRALADGTFGSWTPTSVQTVRLHQIFPEGVCA